MTNGALSYLDRYEVDESTDPGVIFYQLAQDNDFTADDELGEIRDEHGTLICTMDDIEKWVHSTLEENYDDSTDDEDDWDDDDVEVIDEEGDDE